MKTIIFFTFIGITLFGNAQINSDHYTQEIQLHRLNSRKELITEAKAPIQVADTVLLDYFSPNITWKIRAEIVFTPNDSVFQMPTSSGTTKPYKRFAIAKMKHHNQEFELSIYQNQTFLNNSDLNDYLFIPFLDATNGETTYEGGRYIDLRIHELKNELVEIDFNKCYNPYCAYSSGYNCPVPPVENRLKIPIEAGEKKFRKTNH